MYATSSAIVWDTYPRPESLIAVKKKSKKKYRKISKEVGKDYLESFKHYYDSKIDEVVQPGAVEPSSEEQLEPVVFYVDGSSRIVYPQNEDIFEPQELRQLIGAKRVKVHAYGPDAYLVVDLDGDEKPVNVKGTILLNAIEKTGNLVGGNCMLVPAHLMP